MLGGKRRDMGLGAFPAVSLKEARAKADAARKLAAEKRDPIAARREEREAIAVARAAEEEQRARTFRDVAEALIKAQSPAWTSTKTLASWRLTLDKHGYPVLGGWSCPHQTGQAAWVADCAAMNSRGERMRKPL
jgi:hypothetical protein